MDVIVGTAGHIDHGKTALIRALTGVDTDRLPEEKTRGITIDLGFAEMEAGDIRFGFVDVPGHERFVKNMLAGASGIDLVMLAVAANEGVMPQTREHFEICRLLGIKTGLVVLTKADLVDEETIELAKADVADLIKHSFLESSPLVAVSSSTGAGIADLRNILVTLAGSISHRERSLVTRLPIDRSFSVKGFGTVVTGTLASGDISEGDELELFPIERTLRVRGLQSYGNATKTAHAGQRTAVNLGGIDRSEITRGMVLAAPHALRTTQMIDVRLEVLKSAKRAIRTRDRVRIHIGTAEVLARVFTLNETGEIAPGETDLVQLRSEAPIATLPGERFVVRSYSPQTTIAGGEVLDPLPDKHRKKDVMATRIFLRSLEAAADETAKVKLFIERTGEKGIDLARLQASTGLRQDRLAEAVGKNLDSRDVAECSGRYLSQTAFHDLQTRAVAAIRTFHAARPLATGISKETLKDAISRYITADTFKAVIASLELEKAIEIENEMVRAAGQKTSLSKEEAVVLERLRSIYNEAGLEAARLEDTLDKAAASTRIARDKARTIFQLLIKSGEVVKINEEIYVSGPALMQLEKTLRSFAAATADRTIEVPKFKEIAGVSRKYAIPLLEYFDRSRVTRRIGDKRHVL